MSTPEELRPPGFRPRPALKRRGAPSKARRIGAAALALGAASGFGIGVGLLLGPGHGGAVMAAVLLGHGVAAVWWWRGADHLHWRRRRATIERQLLTLGYAAAGAHYEASLGRHQVQVRLVGSGDRLQLRVAVCPTGDQHRLEIDLGTEVRGDQGLGDPAFDAEVGVRGPEVAWRGALNAEARAAVLALVAHGGRVEAGEVVIPLLDQPQLPLDGFARWLKGWGLLAARFVAAPSEHPARLNAVLAEGGPVVLQAATFATLDTWARDRRQRAAQWEALAAQNSVLLDLCLAELCGREAGGLIARQLSAEGRLKPHVVDAQAVAAGYPQRRWQKRLVDALWATHPKRERAPRLRALLGHADPKLVYWAIHLITEHAVPVEPARMEALGERDRQARKPPWLAPALLTWWSTQPDAAREPALITFLTHPDRSVVERAVDQLGEVGSRLALAPLRAVRGHPLAVKEALAAIIARLPAAPEAGGLALSAEAEGGLALSSDGGLGLVPFDEKKA